MLTLNLSTGKRIALLVCFFIVGFFIYSVVSGICIHKFGIDSTPAMRIVTVLQDLCLFVIPAFATAFMVTRQPDKLLCVDKLPHKFALMFGLFVVVAATPLINSTIWLNSNIPLPTDIATTIQQIEDQAQKMTVTLMGAPDVPNLILGILIVGVLAGFSEELFFRGGLQRLMITGGINAHAAIWFTAAVFSFMHFQFYGFIPRMLLGALFGYAFWFTQSIWVPIAMHIFNNTLYIIFQWFNGDTTVPSELDKLGVSGNLWGDIAMVVISLLCVLGGMGLIYAFRTPRER